MDPNETLNDLRNLIEAFEEDDATEFARIELIEKFKALDAWLSSGGFLPRSWDLAIAKRPVEPARRDAIAVLRDHLLGCDRCDRDNEHNFVEGKCLCCSQPEPEVKS